MKRRLAILGSTGSIGVQSLDVVKNHSDYFEVEILAANNNSALLIEQAKAFKPNVVVINNLLKYDEVKAALDPLDIKVYTGEESLCQVVEMETIDMVIVAMVGFAGLRPTISAINAGKAIAIANKEVLVVAGQLVTELAMKKNVPLLPIDSEHSAIFQCLTGEISPVEKIYLTASGGPFRGKKVDELEGVTIKQALNHPNWSMGNKITIDSATMMNKGLEVIEAKWLFGLKPEQIDILIHPQSIVHSMVQFGDGSVKAQLGLADMRVPIQYALSYPHRMNVDFGRVDFSVMNNLNFEIPDKQTFTCINLAYEALSQGGNMPCILNAANEIAVASFLCGKIGFLDIPNVIERCMNLADFDKQPDLDSLFNTNAIVRKMAQDFCKSSTSKP